MIARPSRLVRLTWLLPPAALALGLLGTWGGAPVQASQAQTPPKTQTPPASQSQQAPGQVPGQRPAGPPRTGPGGGPTEWWHDEAVKKELNLTEQQIGRIDRIYDKRAKEIDPFVQDWVKQRDELERMTRERVVDLSTYQIQVGRTDTAYSRIHESRTVMLYSMYLVLTPDQYQKLLAYFDRNRGRRGGGGPHH